MSDIKYNWKRFLCPRDEYDNLDWGNGWYLPDPNTEDGLSRNPQVTSLDKIAHIPCLVILGEPGIGKSTVLSTEQERINKLGEKSISLDFRECPSYDYLQYEIFRSEEFNQWRYGNHSLYIFLDSLDEGLLTINQFSGFVSREIGKYVNDSNRDRLFLRLTCRSAHWSTLLEDKLRGLWEEKLKVFTLLPLREKDIIEAVKSEGIESSRTYTHDFLIEINVKNIESFASIPITLKFLIDTYKKHSKLPSNSIDLYIKGCQILCEDVNKISSHQMKLEPEERMIVAARIAAVTAFSGRAGIWLDSDAIHASEGDVTIKELIGGFENVHGNFKIDRSAIEETIATGLFISIKKGSAGQCFYWRHEAYAEFLAAWYLKIKKINLNTFLNLFTLPLFGEQVIIPQLQETAVLLSSIIPEVFDWILENEGNLLSPEDAVFDNIKDPKLYLQCLLKLFTNNFYSADHDPDSFESFSCSVHCSKFDRNELERELKALYKGSEASRFFACIMINNLGFNIDNFRKNESISEDGKIKGTKASKANIEARKKERDKLTRDIRANKNKYRKNAVIKYIDECKHGLKNDPNIRYDFDVERDILIKLADDPKEFFDVAKQLSEDRLGKFIVWLIENYCLMDVNRNYNNTVKKFVISKLYTDLQLALEYRGTFEALKALKKILDGYLNYSFFYYNGVRNRWLSDSWKPSSPEALLESILHPKKAEVVLCLQEIPQNTKHKSYFAEIVVYPEKEGIEKQYRLGKCMLRFFYTILKVVESGRNSVDKTILIKVLNYQETDDPYWFSRRIGYIKKWLKERGLSSYFRFPHHAGSDLTVEITLDKDQILINEFNYNKAKAGTAK